MEDVKEVVSMRQLLECGVHFGHQTKRWNPKMKKYIFTSRNGIHVIDLQQTMQLINVSYEFVKEVVKNDGDILFVGTKKQAQEAIEQESTRCEMPYVNFRWLGGTLTNISTIRQSINKLRDYERLKGSDEFENLTKKEQSIKNKSYQKSNKLLVGIKNMIKIPSAMFVVDTKKEKLAIREARNLGIPIIGIVDTNADPNEVDYPIPANDDAIRAVKLICSVIADAVTQGNQERLVQEQEQRELEEKKKEAIKKEQEAAQAKSETSQVKSPATKNEKEVKVVKKEVKPKKATVKEEKKEEKKEAVAKTKKAEKKAPAKEKKEAVKETKKVKTAVKKETKPAKKTATKSTTKKEETNK